MWKVLEGVNGLIMLTIFLVLSCIKKYTCKKIEGLSLLSYFCFQVYNLNTIKKTQILTFVIIVRLTG